LHCISPEKGIGKPRKVGVADEGNRREGLRDKRELARVLGSLRGRTDALVIVTETADRGACWPFFGCNLADRRGQRPQGRGFRSTQKRHIGNRHNCLLVSDSGEPDTLGF
jgi:hypothetical protein